MTKKGSLVHVGRTGGELGPVIRPDEHPAIVYLEGLAPSSKPAMRSALNKIAALVNKDADYLTLKWQTMRFSHTQKIRNDLTTTYEPRSVNRMICAMRGVLKAAWKLELMSTDDYMRARDVRMMSTTGLPPAGRHLETEEIAALLRTAAAEPEPLCFRDQALLVMLFAGGLRRQEASAFNTADYEPKTGAFFVKRGKGGKYRDLAIADGYRDWLKPWHDFQRQRKSEAFFVRWTGSEKNAHRGQPTLKRLGCNGVDHALERVRKAANVADFDPHDLRRSFATSLLDAGVDVMVVQDLMGHASLTTTKIYDRRGAKTRIAAVERLPVALDYDEVRR